jgi:hypothetical protein
MNMWFARLGRCVCSIPFLRRIVERKRHPWFAGFEQTSVRSCDSPVEASPAEVASALPSPIMFLARGHSGTTPLAKILEMAGVYMGNRGDRNALNSTLDALYWIYGFQRPLVVELFRPPNGCFLDQALVTPATLECLNRHLRSYTGGNWGFKTCAGMFAHPLYRAVFPEAKYIYLIRDGRDVILSGNGFFHLTHPFSRYRHWEYFKLITFGISNDIDSCPFDFPEEPWGSDPVMQNRFWIQAKSWREHVRMVEHLKKAGKLSPNVHTVRYEHLCENPVSVLKQLFAFLEIELAEEVKNFATKMLHTESIGRWRRYSKYISDCNEDMESVFESMEPELELLGYLE